MREPILFVLDEDDALNLQVMRVAAGIRPRPNVVWCDGFDAIDRLVSEHGPCDVLIAGPLVFKDQGFRGLAALRARMPDMSLVLATDRWRTASLRDTVRTRALDILRLPVTDDDLLAVIEQAVASGAQQSRSASDHRDAGPLHDDGGGQGRVMAVVSGTGGCGKTFFATNLAYHLQTVHNRRTCLIDLDLQFGELSTALRLKPKYSIRDLVSDAGDDLAGRFLEHLQLHESGMHILAAPEEPADADAIDAEDLAQVIAAARTLFDDVIVDTPSALSDSVMVPVEHADEIFVMATLDLPSVRNLGVLLSTFKKLRVPQERLQLVLNKVEPNVGMDISRVERYFPQGFTMVIPYGREVNRSLNMGQPVLAYAPRGEVSKAVAAGLNRAMAGDLVGAEDPASTVSASRRRLSGWRNKKPA
jgi:pilus assembly protein CpaE